ncbi:MAG: hypothetical protein BWY26_01011 [Elusimicrobia bacterium ADurb.Bin231]|nr:MAG: hypothetical protein BWY26_01011 [Elusimicrobia bacterium ADurb.Bin231]
MKIFISSTYRDLKQIRESIQRSLNKAESFYSRGMEFFSASNDSPSDTCLTEIQKADLIILIISDNYGSIVPGSNLSYTHLEFREAVKYKKPILAFLYENPSDPFVQTFQNEVLGLNKVVDQFCNEHELLGKIWPALFDYLYENGIIVQDSTFQKFGDFYSKYLNQNAVFNLCQPFIGRKDIITQLISFISGPQKICIILGVGGIGKTKLLYEFSNNFKDDKYELRFLSPYKNFSQQSILELPQKPTCVVIEDAHRRSDLNAIFETVLSNNNYKIILTSRQSGLATLHKLTSLFQEDDILRINLDNLGKTDAIVLAEEVLGDNFKQYAKTLVRQSSGSTLVICIGGKLIRDGKVSSTLIDNEDFKYNAVENLLEEAYLHHEPLKTNIKKLLEILAGINPFSVNSSLDVIAKEIGLEKYQVSQLIRHLKTIGLLIERGEKLRIAPDVFADNLIFNASCSTGQYSSDFIDYLITNFGDEYFLNILKNAAELEFSLNINRNKLTENAWEIFFKKFENVSFDKLINLCEQLKEVSYFAPDKALKIINFVIENFENDLADGRLIDRISAILQEIGIHPEFTKTICHILWRLCKEETKGTSENSGAYIFNVFKKLASLDNGNTCEAVEGALDAVKEILESNKLNKTHCLLFEVLNSSLSAELEFNSYNARQFSISWVSPFNQPTEVLNKIKKIRYKAINLINLFVKTSDKNVIKSTIDFLLLHISWPYMHGNRTSNFENELNKEGIEFLKIFKEIIAKNNNDFLIAYIRTKLEAKNSIIDSVKQKLDDNYLNIPKKTHEELLFFCLLNEWAPHICLNIEDDNKLFQKQQEDTAKWFWQKCDNDPAKLITELTNHLEQLKNIVQKLTIARCQTL